MSFEILFPFGLWVFGPGWLLDHSQLVWRRPCSSQNESGRCPSVNSGTDLMVCCACVCVWLMCGSALFEPCGAAFFRVAPLQSLDSSSPSRFSRNIFPPAETGALSCFSVQAALGAIAARAHGLEATLGGPRLGETHYRSV